MELQNNVQFSHISNHFEKGKSFETHCHHDYEICYVVEGEITLKVEGNSYALRNGMGVVVKPLQYHSLTSNKNQRYERLIFKFDKSMLPEPIRRSFNEAVQPIKIISNSNILTNFADLNKFKTELPDSDFAELYYSFFVQMAYLFTYSPTIENDLNNYVPANNSVRDILEYINKNLTKKITLAELSNLTHLSITPMSTLFKKEMGISIKAYIIRKKLTYAQKLIASGKTALYASLEIGYHNYNNFYLLYKKTFGTSPSQDQSQNKTSII